MSVNTQVNIWHANFNSLQMIFKEVSLQPERKKILKKNSAQSSLHFALITGWVCTLVLMLLGGIV